MAVSRDKVASSWGNKLGGFSWKAGLGFLTHEVQVVMYVTFSSYSTAGNGGVKKNGLIGISSVAPSPNSRLKAQHDRKRNKYKPISHNSESIVIQTMSSLFSSMCPHSVM